MNPQLVNLLIASLILLGCIAALVGIWMMHRAHKRRMQALQAARDAWAKGPYGKAQLPPIPPSLYSRNASPRNQLYGNRSSVMVFDDQMPTTSPPISFGAPIESSPEPYRGGGGEFSGAGASGSWDSGSSSSSSDSSSSSSSSSDSGSSSSGGSDT